MSKRKCLKQPQNKETRDRQVRLMLIGTSYWYVFLKINVYKEIGQI